MAKQTGDVELYMDIITCITNNKIKLILKMMESDYIVNYLQNYPTIPFSPLEHPYFSETYDDDARRKIEKSTTLKKLLSLLHFSSSSELFQVLQSKNII